MAEATAAARLKETEAYATFQQDDADKLQIAEAALPVAAAPPADQGVAPPAAAPVSRSSSYV